MELRCRYPVEDDRRQGELVKGVGADTPNRAPAFGTASVSFSIAEDIAGGQNVGTPVTATDADTGDTLAYALGGADAASFDIGPSSGQILSKAGAYDFETKPSLAVTVRASDGARTVTKMVTITVQRRGASRPPRPPRPLSAPSPTAPPACRCPGPPRSTPASPPSPATTCSTARAPAALGRTGRKT